METTTDRTTAAEARFVEEGHRAVLARDEQGPYIRVVSETLGQRGIAYKVRVVTAGPGRPLIFDCEADGHVGPHGHGPLSSTAGRPPCKHAAGAARRLGREGFAEVMLPGVHGDIVTRDTRWLASGRMFTWDAEAQRPGRAEAMTAAAEGKGGDPFAGFA